MSALEDAAAAPGKAAAKIGGWAKAAPVIFTILILLAVIAAIRWRNRLAMFFAKIPGVRTLAGLSAPNDTAPSAPQGG